MTSASEEFSWAAVWSRSARSSIRSAASIGAPRSGGRSSEKRNATHSVSSPRRARTGSERFPSPSKSEPLRVAFVDPSDLAAIDEVAAITECRVVPAVTSEVRLMQAHEKYYGRSIPQAFGTILKRLDHAARQPRGGPRTANPGVPPPPPALRSAEPARKPDEAEEPGDSVPDRLARASQTDRDRENPGSRSPAGSFLRRVLADRFRRGRARVRSAGERDLRRPRSRSGTREDPRGARTAGPRRSARARRRPRRHEAFAQARSETVGDPTTSSLERRGPASSARRPGRDDPSAAPNPARGSRSPEWT